MKKIRDLVLALFVVMILCCLLVGCGKTVVIEGDTPVVIDAEFDITRFSLSYKMSGVADIEFVKFDEEVVNIDGVEYTYTLAGKFLLVEWLDVRLDFYEDDGDLMCVITYSDGQELLVMLLETEETSPVEPDDDEIVDPDEEGEPKPSTPSDTDREEEPIYPVEPTDPYDAFPEYRVYDGYWQSDIGGLSIYLSGNSLMVVYNNSQVYAGTNGGSISFQIGNITYDAYASGNTLTLSWYGEGVDEYGNYEYISMSATFSKN